jgi:hypothetical protein
VLQEEQEFWDVHIPGTENYLAEGAVHHNCGKTYTGAQFAVFNFINHPDKTGLIASNNHDQLSQATLRELFYWLDAYGLEYVVDRIPPAAWGVPRRFKTYRNILSVRNPRNGKVAHAFVRILSDADALRGIEISWYWLDETRDTPEDTHDVVISRMRESEYKKGIITTTTNGEDWSFRRFVKGARRNDFLYGSMHVKTIESVKLHIIDQSYYDSMARSYSPLKAAQELDAQHVNLLGGRAYYTAGSDNTRSIAPWGDAVPNRERPLIVGCDFNFSPAPCIWMIGQIGPNVFGPNGEHFGSMIHWFGEIAEPEMSSAGMAMILINRYPEFFYRVFGDCSGGIGTTSNAGVTDYDQIASVFQQARVGYSIDYFQSEESQNPKVKARVENMNRLFKNALGEVRMTYNKDSCPYFHDDIKIVGWKTTTQGGRGKLSDGGDHLRTHATDAAGYAVYKLLPPTANFRVHESVPSPIRSEYGLFDQNPQRY